MSNQALLIDDAEATHISGDCPEIVGTTRRAMDVHQHFDRLSSTSITTRTPLPADPDLASCQTCATKKTSPGKAKVKTAAAKAKP